MNREEYYKQHVVCPKCRKNTGQTYVWYMFTGDNFKDENRATCSCGWSGTVHDLVPKDKGGRPRIYTDDMVLKLLMVMIMNQIKDFKGLRRYLKKNKPIMINCGLNKVPSDRTLRRRLKRFMPIWINQEEVRKIEDQKHGKARKTTTLFR